MAGPKRKKSPDSKLSNQDAVISSSQDQGAGSAPPKKRARDQKEAPAPQRKASAPAKASKKSSKETNIKPPLSSSAKVTVKKTASEKPPASKSSPSRASRKTPQTASSKANQKVRPSRPAVAKPVKKSSPAKKSSSAAPVKKPRTAASVKKPAAVKKSSKSGTSSSDSSRKKSPSSSATTAPSSEHETVVVAYRRCEGVSEGVALAVGEGDAGQLGLGGDVTECRRFKQLPCKSGQTVVDVCAGAMHSLYLTNDGQVFSFGCNDECGLGRSSEPAEGESGHEEEDGESRAWPVQGIQGRVVQLAAGDSFSAALTDTGTVYMWGTFRDSSGAIGLQRALQMERVPVRVTSLHEPVTSVAAGSNHVVVLTARGHVYTAGNAEQGQLARVSEMLSCRGGRRGLEYLLTPGRVTLGGRDRDRLFDAVWAGAFCTVLRCADTGAIYVAGLNNYSQLSLSQLVVWRPSLATSFSDIKMRQFVGALHHSVCLSAEGHVFTLGRKEDGRLGIADLQDDLRLPTLVPALSEVKCRQVTAAGYTTMAVTESGELYSWGMGSTGQLGLGDDEDRHQPDLVKAKALEGKQVYVASAGGTHTLCLAAPVLNNGHTA